MAIRTVVTRGFGNGTFNGTVGLVVTRGYAIGSVAELVPADYARLTERKVAARLNARAVAARLSERQVSVRIKE